MLITQLPLEQYDPSKDRLAVDLLHLEWYECNKRIQHKQTDRGRLVRFKFLQENPLLKDGDIVYRDNTTLIVIDVLPCEVMVLSPASILEASSVCYEIGNKHLPLYHEGNELLVPYEAPLYRLLQASGYTARIEKRKLINSIKTSVQPHGNSASGSLFNRILQITGA